MNYLGPKIRKESPLILKELINSIQTKIEVFQNSLKAKFILLLLNDIRMNKNLKSNPMERMEVIVNWLKK